MLFLEPWFWVFAAIVVVVSWLCPSKLKVYWLLGASLTFQYHFAGPAGVAPIVVLAILTYATALVRPRATGPTLFSVTAIVIVGALAFYKYSRLVLHTGHRVFAVVADPAWIASWPGPAVPLGISFFTFEFLHYLYEVRMGGREPVRNPVHFALFSVFFPTLAAGPIKRFPDFVPQLSALENPDLRTIGSGLRRVIRGLFKKVCIADLLVEYVAVLELLPRQNTRTVGALAVIQGLRIYYDFAGYSDIAIGLAQLVNLRVPENFDHPYWSTSLQDFWRRWHISLSSWIRDYVYIPLGGNRVRRGFNLMVAMVLCGLWHGAAWHFALWGVYHGAGLALEGGVRRWRPTWFGEGWGQRLAGWAVCYAFVTYGWLIFFYPTDKVWTMTKGLLQW